MENSLIRKNRNAQRRAMRVRKKLKGTSERPRLCVVKSNCHINIQLINDETGTTLASISTLSPEFRSTEGNRKNKATGHQLGLKIAQLALGKDVSKVVFDRGKCKYHGVVAAVAEGAREGGLEL